ncbi:hypothetical protein CYMTET_7158, partial [Cymbomonas tetramitiformis]
METARREGASNDRAKRYALMPAEEAGEQRDEEEEEEEEEDTELCRLCGSGDQKKGDLILYCDTCDERFHQRCHAPPVYKIPKGEWHCAECRARRSGAESQKGQQGDEEAPGGEVSRLGIDGGGDGGLSTAAETPKRAAQGMVGCDKARLQLKGGVAQEVDAGSGFDAGKVRAVDEAGDVLTDTESALLAELRVFQKSTRVSPPNPSRAGAVSQMLLRPLEVVRLYIAVARTGGLEAVAPHNGGWPRIVTLLQWGLQVAGCNLSRDMPKGYNRFVLPFAEHLEARGLSLPKALSADPADEAGTLQDLSCGGRAPGGPSKPAQRVTHPGDAARGADPPACESLALAVVTAEAVEDTDVCRVCGSGQEASRNRIVFCNTCDDPYHQQCHVPQVHALFKGAWHCAECRPAGNTPAPSADQYGVLPGPAGEPGAAEEPSDILRGASRGCEVPETVSWDAEMPPRPPAMAVVLAPDLEDRLQSAKQANNPTAIQQLIDQFRNRLGQDGVSRCEHVLRFVQGEVRALHAAGRHQDPCAALPAVAAEQRAFPPHDASVVDLAVEHAAPRGRHGGVAPGRRLTKCPSSHPRAYCDVTEVRALLAAVDGDVALVANRLEPELQNNFTLLARAAAEGHEGVVRALIDSAQASAGPAAFLDWVDARSPDGNTALFWACEGARVGVVDAL